MLHPHFCLAAASLALLLPACGGPPRTFKSVTVDEGRPGEAGYRSATTTTWSSDPGVEPPRPQLPSRLEYASERTRRADEERARDRGH